MVHGNNPHASYLGVYWNKKKNLWGARITVKGERFDLGAHTSQEAAFAAYVEGKRKHHPGGML